MRRESAEASLVRAVATWGLAAAIINVTVGGGIYRLAAGASAALGPSAALAYVVCAVAMGLIVLCFAEAGSRVSLTGGLYAYVEVAFGPFVGFITGVLLWAGMSAALAAVASFFADAVVALAPGLAAWRAVLLAVLLGGLGALNVAGVRGANRFNEVMTVAKLLPLALLILGGVTAIRGANLAWHGTPPPANVARASAFLIFAFLGVESALVPSGEVRDPARTVPRAIFIAMVTVTVLYLAVQLVVQGILGPALPGQQTPLAEAARIAMGGWAREVLLIGSIVSMFGYVSGMTLAVPRVLFAFARDGFLPGVLASVHARFRTPWLAIIVQTLIVIVLAATGTFERLALTANGSILLAYSACCIAVLELRRRDVHQAGAPFRAPALRFVPILALAVMIWLLTSLKPDEWAGLGLVVLVGIVLYLATSAGRRLRAPASVS